MWRLLIIVFNFVASFDVRVLDKHLTALRGQSIVLGCTFTPDPDLFNLVVTWQRQEDLQVVHSFYYNQDHMEHQSPKYHNRTSLYLSELQKGNASLKINSVIPADTGRYLCIVSNGRESGKVIMEVSYAALYPEPRMSINISSSGFTITFETEGFPKPEVSWLGEDAQNLLENHHLQVNEQEEDGLYFIKSRYDSQLSVVNVTFILKNNLQYLQRPVFISHEQTKCPTQARTAVTVLSLLCAFLLLVIICLVLQILKKKSSNEPRQSLMQ